MKEYLWRSIGESGVEHLRITDDHPEWNVFDSMIIRVHEGRVYRGGFTVVADKAWRTLELRAMVEDEPGQMMAVHLLSDGEGNWTDAENRKIARFDGIFDVDVQWSAFTNTLPMNRTKMEQDKERPVRAIYVAFPSLELSVRRQGYTRREDESVVYRSGDFEATLDVDGDGFVREYPGLFVREFPVDNLDASGASATGQDAHPGDHDAVGDLSPR